MQISIIMKPSTLFPPCDVQVKLEATRESLSWNHCSCRLQQGLRPWNHVFSQNVENNHQFPESKFFRFRGPSIVFSQVSHAFAVPPSCSPGKGRVQCRILWRAIWWGPKPGWSGQWGVWVRGRIRIGCWPRSWSQVIESWGWQWQWSYFGTSGEWHGKPNGYGCSMQSVRWIHGEFDRSRQRFRGGVSEIYPNKDTPMEGRTVHDSPVWKQWTTQARDHRDVHWFDAVLRVQPSGYRQVSNLDLFYINLFLNIYLCFSLHPPIYPSTHPVFLQSMHLSFHLSIYPSITQSIQQSLSPSTFYLWVYLFMHLSIYLPIHPSIHWPNYPSTHLSIHIWIHPPMYPLIKLTILYLAYLSAHLSICTMFFSNPSIGSSFIYLSIKSISTQIRIRDASCFLWLYPKLPTCWFIATVYVCPVKASQAD